MIEFITANWVEILAAISSVLVALTHIAALTPTTKDDEAVSTIKKIFNALTGNYGSAKNASEESKKVE